jgi:hypothetical protein
MFHDFDCLQKEWVKVSAVTNPDPESQMVYNQYYQIFVELHMALEKVHQHIHEVQIIRGG